MTVHLVKMAVGADSIEDIAMFQKQRRAKLKAERGKPILIHKTRNMPKRESEIIKTGSIYWIVKGFIRVRQRILGFEKRADQEGRPFCEIRLDPKLVRTVPFAHKPIQGWRYMEEEAVPADLTGRAAQAEEMPPEMMMQLRELGLL
jgi:hypothetical protein